MCGIGPLYHFYWPSNTTSGIVVRNGDVPKLRTFLGKVPNKIKCDLPFLVAFLKKNISIYLNFAKKNTMCLYIERSFDLGSDN